jgi:hypothetical protein
MSFGKLNVTLPLGVEVHFSHAAQTTQASQSASISSGETSEVKISRVTSVAGQYRYRSHDRRH